MEQGQGTARSGARPTRRSVGRMLLTAGVAASLIPATLTSAPVHAADSPFQPVVKVSTAEEPRDVVLVDVDQDGGLDLVVAAAKLDQISVIEGPDDGSMTGRTDLPGGQDPTWMAAGDLNRDGDPDIVTAGRTLNNRIYVLYGKAGSHFATPIAIPTGHRPTDVEIVDLDQDGALEIVVADQGSGTITILQRVDDTTYTPTKVTVPGGTYQLAVGDMNGDGDPDIATVKDTTTTILLGQEGLGFAAPITYKLGADMASVALGDLDGDGVLDLVASRFRYPPTPSLMFVMKGAGDGTFGAATSYPTSQVVRDTEIADFDGDGNADVATSSEYANELSLHRGNGDGTLEPRTILPAGGNNGYGMAVGDINGDNSTDLALTQAPVRGSPGVLALYYGFPRAKITLSRDSIDFGAENVDGFSDAEVLTVSNTGSFDAEIGDVTLAGSDAEDFELFEFCSNELIEPNRSCEVEVRFTPGSAGPKSAELQIPHDLPGSPATVQLTGTAIGEGDVPPTAVDDEATVAQDSGPNDIDVLGNDLDPDGGELRVESVTQPVHGTVAVAGGGARVTYRPDAGYCNEPGAEPADTFDYTVNGGSSATVAVTVSCQESEEPPPAGDTTPPETTITASPGLLGLSLSKTATYRFASSEAGVTFECRFDAEEFAACTSPTTRVLTPGKHTFEVRAKDAAGNVDPTPAVHVLHIISL